MLHLTLDTTGMTPRNPKQLVRQVGLLRQRFTSLEAMAEALRAHPGFEQLNRATLSSWLKHPPARAKAAVEILSFRRQPARLRIAETSTLSAIPSSMLHWASEAGKPYGSLETQYGVKVEVHPSRHGGPALELLLNDRVDLALIPSDMINQLAPHCARVCLLSKLYISGLATRPVESVFDLKGKRFGVLSGSAFAARLSHESRNWGLELRPPLVLPAPQDCVRALIEGKIDCMAGSEPSISQIRRAANRTISVHTIPHGVLGWFEMHLAVNLKTANPAAVRAYLCALQEAVPYTNGRKSVAGFQKEIAARFKMDPSDVRNVLANIIFTLGDFEPRSILALWEREILSLRRLP